MDAPQIWNYHPVTLALLRTAEPCYPDPDPEVSGEWLYPGCTTPAKPGPDIADKVQKIDLDAGKWVYEDILPGTVEVTPAVGESTSEELAAAVALTRDQLLQLAALRIAPLQDAHDLGIATAEEETALTSWKQYRITVNRVSQQEDYPQTVIWPIPPAG